jgi:trans-aconitate methyltransferase
MEKSVVAVKRYYDKNAKEWTQTKWNSFQHEEQFRVFVKLIPTNASVLDIGCASGMCVPLFLGIGNKLKYTGIDFSRNMIKIAQSRYPQLSFKLADIQTFKTARKFDAFWAAAVLMHVPIGDWPRLLGNIERNMCPGATGYITLPSVQPNSAKSGRREK